MAHKTCSTWLAPSFAIKDVPKQATERWVRIGARSRAPQLGSEAKGFIAARSVWRYGREWPIVETCQWTPAGTSGCQSR